MSKCFECDAEAVWFYLPETDRNNTEFCDKHVPRGCSCNVDDDGTEELDYLGRRLPCCEFIYDDEYND
jgi:hypothetical protein